MSLRSSAAELTRVTDRDGRFEFLGVPAGVYSLHTAMPGFVPVDRDDINVSEGAIADLQLTLELGELSADPPPLLVVLSPGSAYRHADAVVRLRIGERRGEVIVDRFLTEHEAGILDVFKAPADGAPLPAPRHRLTPPPVNTIRPDGTITVFQIGPAVDAPGRTTPYRTGDELIALLWWSCREQWTFSSTFPVHDGIVSVPSTLSADGHPLSAEWRRLDSQPIIAFIDELERLAKEGPQ